MTRPPCEVPGCGRPHYGHGYCRAHHARWLRHGHPRADCRSRRRPPVTRVLSVSGASPAGARGPGAQRGSGAPAAAAGSGVVLRRHGPRERVGPDTAAATASTRPATGRAAGSACNRPPSISGAAFPRPRPRPALDVERAARLYAAGANSRGLAALMGVSPGTVRRALRAHGVTIRPPIAAARRARRYRITAAPSTTGSTPRDHHTNDTIHPSSIFTNDSAIHSRQPSTHTTTTTSSQRTDQNQGQHKDPRAQCGPTHQRSLGVDRVPCGPAAPDETR